MKTSLQIEHLLRWVELGGGEEEVLEKAALAVDKVREHWNGVWVEYSVVATVVTIIVKGEHQWGLQLTDILIDSGRESDRAKELRGICLRWHLFKAALNKMLDGFWRLLSHKWCSGNWQAGRFLLQGWIGEHWQALEKFWSSSFAGTSLKIWSRRDFKSGLTCWKLFLSLTNFYDSGQAQEPLLSVSLLETWPVFSSMSRPNNC